MYKKLTFVSVTQDICIFIHRLASVIVFSVKLMFKYAFSYQSCIEYKTGIAKYCWRQGSPRNVTKPIPGNWTKDNLRNILF